MQKIYFKLYKWLEKKVRASCQHNLEYKDYLYCTECGHKHPHWLPIGEEKKGK